MWKSDEAEVLAAEMSAQLRRPGSDVRLYAHQAIALYELWRCRGLHAPLPVGTGKTLISYLAPRVFGAARSVLLIPAKLREKTLRDFATLAKDWGEVAHFIESYERISIDYARPNFLEAYAPDLLICDESHRIKNTGAACTRKISRFLRGNAQCAFVSLSGTALGRTLDESAHLMRYALGDGAPIPRDPGTLREWSAALDVGVTDARRIAPGPLAALPGAHGIDPIERARTGYCARILGTPGIVGLENDRPPASLLVRSWQYEGYAPATEQAFTSLRQRWQRPDDSYVGDPMTFWRHAYEMALGYWGRWDPWPPDEWRQRRQDWYRVVREILTANRSGIDSEGALRRALYGVSHWPNAREILAKWSAVEPSFVPNPVAVWIDEGPLHAVAEYAQNTRCIVWSGSVPFAERLSKLSGMPYYGEQGQDDRGIAIENATSVTKGSIIASIASNCEGRNLQKDWNSNFVVTWPSSGKIVEQLLGRTHRAGQIRDEVECTIFMACEEHVKAWEQSLRDAQCMRDLGGVCAKLTYCDKDVEVNRTESVRWEELEKWNGRGETPRLEKRQ
jgi:hypothetical protein